MFLIKSMMILKLVLQLHLPSIHCFYDIYVHLDYSSDSVNKCLTISHFWS